MSYLALSPAGGTVSRVGRVSRGYRLAIHRAGHNSPDQETDVKRFHSPKTGPRAGNRVPLLARPAVPGTVPIFARGLSRFLRSRRRSKNGTVPLRPRRVPLAACQPVQETVPRRRAYTLVEMLMSVTLTLIMMALVVQIFGLVGSSVDNSRAVLEMNDQLRSATARLRLDLQGVTADMTPPLSPEAGKGYFEYIEGPRGPVYLLHTVALNTDDPANPADTTVADNDDILMFTTRSRGDPLVGRVFVRSASGDEQKSAESEIAEVCWFVRGTTLYRRVLLIKPDFDPHLGTPVREILSWANLVSGSGSLYQMPDAPLFASLADADRGFYNNFDLSVRLEGLVMGDAAPTDAWVWVPNTLADLTKRENRFAHELHQSPGRGFPFHPHMQGPTGSQVYTNWRYLGLPTLRECSWCQDASNAWWPGFPRQNVSLTLLTPFTAEQFDAWNTPLPYSHSQVDPDTGTLKAYPGPRVAEDVILTNVIGFDVKAWDPGALILSYRNTGVACVPGDRGYPPWDKPTRPQSEVLDILQGTHADWHIVGHGAYVDLDYALPFISLSSLTLDEIRSVSFFSGPPDPRSRVTLTYPNGVPLPNASSTYDTWSTHYEKDGDNQDGVFGPDQGTNGFDDGGVPGIVDDALEQEAPPPYAVPLRGIRIKIRVFEPDTRQIREVTIVQDFLRE